MRTVRFLTVLQGIAHLAGIDLDQLTDADKTRATAYINTHVERGWKHDFWPEWTLAEQRAWRDTWSAVIIYLPGTEVLFPVDGLYYSANSAPNNPALAESPATNPEKWTAVTNLTRYIALEQAGQTSISEVKRLCRRDPLLNPRQPGVIRHALSARGIIPLDACDVSPVWVEFRTAPPVFTVEAYDAAAAYLGGDLALWTDGDCYKAIADTTGNDPTDATKWERILFPKILEAFVKHAAYADVIRSDSSNKAREEDATALDFLAQVHDEEFAGQGQYDTAQVATY